MPEPPRKQIQRLFNANPPRLGDPLLGHLFVDREAELRHAVELLTADTAFDPQIYAVSGDSRTGKSHLVLRILDRVDDAVAGAMPPLRLTTTPQGRYASKARLEARGGDESTG